MPRNRPELLMFVLIGILLAAVTVSSLLDKGANSPTNPNARSDPANKQITRLSGQARVVDGDTIRLKGQRIRILGIDAPEMKQTCKTSQGAIWACGQKSRQYLLSMLASKNLVCESRARDIYARLLARCMLDGVDIGATMVRSGMAISYYDYKSEESQAKRERVGVWQGEFIKPRAWRNARK
ncbi:hypothetical protein MNBD_ALPHA12-785 [hydrothermal vent metagenome]|uniref:TNase-like domain-containing protein n=1 Tax=hydrothermal vent metagenome TaxID=652676 RepID=A0A3B0U4X3_9ZZZZ